MPHKFVQAYKLMVSILAGVVAALSASQAGACTVSASPLDFGQIDSLANEAYTSTATVTVENCALIVSSFTVAISASANGARVPRAMTSSSYTLNYQIYLDSAMSQVWGDGSFGSVWSGSVPTGGGPTSATAYGRVPNQTLASGSYADSLTITVTF